MTEMAFRKDIEYFVSHHQRFIGLSYIISKPIYYSKQTEYYRLLQDVRDHHNWEDWILFMLEAVINVSKQSISLIKDIKTEMMKYKTLFAAIIRKSIRKIC